MSNETANPVTAPTPPASPAPGTMFCRNCGKQVSTRWRLHVQPAECRHGFRRTSCHHCGKPTSVAQIICAQCGVSLESPKDKGKKLFAGILGICLVDSSAQILSWLYRPSRFHALLRFDYWWHSDDGDCLCVLIAIIGFVEGIIYITKSDQEFARTYIQNKKTWF